MIVGLKERISLLTTQMNDSVMERDNAILEKGKLASSLDKEKKAKLSLKERMKTELKRATKERTELTTKVKSLDNQLENAALVHANHTVKNAKEKVAFCLDQALITITEKCYEDALLLTYGDNINKCLELDFPSLTELNTRFRIKCNLILKVVEGSLQEEFPKEETIDPRRLLSFDDPFHEWRKDTDGGEDGDHENDDDEKMTILVIVMMMMPKIVVVVARS